MKKIGNSPDGVIIEVVPGDVAEIKAIVRRHLLGAIDMILDGMLEAVGITATPTTVTKTDAREQPCARKPAEREIAKKTTKAGGRKLADLGTRVCEGCGAKYQAVRKDQRNCSKKCNRKRSRTAVAQTSKPRTRASKMAAAQAGPTALQRRPPIPTDPNRKVDRLRLIREANERLDAIPSSVAAAIADAHAADDLG